MINIHNMESARNRRALRWVESLGSSLKKSMWSANVAGRVPVEGPFLQPPEGHVGSPEAGRRFALVRLHLEEV